jgi:hypothetical protein
VWTRLRKVVPERTGVLILDGTSFPKQGADISAICGPCTPHQNFGSIATKISPVVGAAAGKLLSHICWNVA